MILQIIIDNPTVVANAVSTAFDTKKAEIVAQLIANGSDAETANTEAESQLASTRLMADYVYFSSTKCVLEFDSDTNGVRVVVDDTLEDNVPPV